MREALNSKTNRQIKRFTKALCQQIEQVDDHPELDLLNVLMDVSSDEEFDDSSVLKLERERKKKERTKMRKLLATDLLVPELAPDEGLKCRASPEQIDSLEKLFKHGTLIDKKARNSTDTVVETSTHN